MCFRLITTNSSSQKYFVFGIHQYSRFIWSQLLTGFKQFKFDKLGQSNKSAEPEKCLGIYRVTCSESYLKKKKKKVRT